MYAIYGNNGILYCNGSPMGYQWIINGFSMDYQWIISGIMDLVEFILCWDINPFSNMF